MILFCFLYYATSYGVSRELAFFLICELLEMSGVFSPRLEYKNGGCAGVDLPISFAIRGGIVNMFNATCCQ
ncbi:unnamed protein product [Tenebrio molitor]|nr:unnamed protein product [Tenebrio molitor]